jgi:hypothetical protein
MGFELRASLLLKVLYHLSHSTGSYRHCNGVIFGNAPGPKPTSTPPLGVCDTKSDYIPLSG